MKSSIRIISLLFSCPLIVLGDCCFTAGAQTVGPPEWTWMGGSNTLPATPASCAGATPGTNLCGTAGAYGTQGSAAATNLPGSRIGAATWTDTNGNFWLFGGWGFDDGKLTGGSAGFGDLNDLWEYQPSTRAWTWVGGSSTANQLGVYGTLGTGTTTNIPSARNGASTWVDKNGKLWLFGGEGNFYPGANNQYYFNDLWEFDPSTAHWTWMSGSSTPDAKGVYGNLGVAAAGNVPGSRSEAASWIDANGNFWLFGGASVTNDLWMYSPTANQWTWIGGGGATSPANQPGVYGTLGTPAQGNFPGARSGASTWTDVNGNLWLFGGTGQGTSKPYVFNDLWEYLPAKNEWAWTSGTALATDCNYVPTCSQGADYGTLATPAASNVPGSRSGAVSWTDKSGNLWLFGGGSAEWYGIEAPGDLNDVWEFNLSLNQWIWMGGDSTIPPPPMGAALGAGGSWYSGEPGVYGTQGIAAAGNIPGGRDTASSWTDSNGNLWLFGGAMVQVSGSSTVNNNNFYFNDLWEASPSSAPPATTPTPTISAVATSNPGIYTVTISDTNPNAIIYYAEQSGGLSSSLSLYTGPITQGPFVNSDPTGIVVPFQAIAIAPNSLNSAVASASVTVPEQTFTLSMPAALSVAVGGSVSATITVNPVNGFNHLMWFTCWNDPTPCTFSPSTVTPSGTGPSTTQITITWPVTTPNKRSQKSNPLLPGAALATLVCCVSWKKQRHWLKVILVCACLSGLGLIGACGGGGGEGTKTAPAKTYQYLVYGQDGGVLVPVYFQLTVTN